MFSIIIVIIMIIIGNTQRLNEKVLGKCVRCSRSFFLHTMWPSWVAVRGQTTKTCDALVQPRNYRFCPTNFQLCISSAHARRRVRFVSVALIGHIVKINKFWNLKILKVLKVLES